MKKTLLNVKLLLVCLLFAGITSCKKNSLEDLPSLKAASEMSINTITGQNSCFDWEASPYITITNGQTRTLPWYNGATTQVPDFILEDYKKEDGWVLLYNMLNGVEVGQNYLIFYNKFTGILRTFYFLAENVNEGSNGMWGLGFTNTNSLLNNTTYFASPIDGPTNNPLATTTNISIDGTTKAITRGWNAFDTEITYDPASALKDIKMRILSYNKNISNIILSGDISLSSSGTIVNIGSKNGVQDAANGAAKYAGKSAGNWVKEKVQVGSGASSVIKLLPGAVAAIASGGVSEIVSAGVNLLFGSFIGKFQKPTSTTQNIEFKTNGKIILTGTSSFTSANNVSPIANLYTPGTLSNTSNFLLPCYDKKLGVWNLATTPVVETDLNPPFDRLVTIGSHPLYFVYSRNYSVVNSSVNVVLNPDILSEIDSYNVSTDLIYYEKFQGTVLAGGILSNRSLLYEDNENRFYKGNIREEFTTLPMDDEHIQNPIPMPSADQPQFYRHFVVKVTVTLIPKSGYDQSPIVITRSYLPNYTFRSQNIANRANVKTKNLTTTSRTQK